MDKETKLSIFTDLNHLALHGHFQVDSWCPQQLRAYSAGNYWMLPQVGQMHGYLCKFYGQSKRWTGEWKWFSFNNSDQGNVFTESDEDDPLTNSLYRNLCFHFSKSATTLDGMNIPVVLPATRNSVHSWSIDEMEEAD